MSPWGPSLELLIRYPILSKCAVKILYNITHTLEGVILAKHSSCNWEDADSSPTRVSYFLSKNRLLQEKNFTTRKWDCCPRMVGYSCVNICKQKCDRYRHRQYAKSWTWQYPVPGGELFSAYKHSIVLRTILQQLKMDAAASIWLSFRVSTFTNQDKPYHY